MKSKRIAILAIVVILLIVVFSIVAKNIISKDTSPDTTTTSSLTSTSVEDTTTKSNKIDDEKEWVYDATYDVDVVKNSYTVEEYGTYDIKNYKVPYFNINSEYAKKVNSEIEELYNDAIEVFNRGEIDFQLLKTFDYEYFNSGNYVSVIITVTYETTSTPSTSYYVYTIDTTNGKKVELQDVLNNAKISETEFKEKAEDKIINSYNWFYKDMSKTDELYTEYYEKLKEVTLKEYNDSDRKFFIDNDGDIYIITPIHFPAGIGFEKRIIHISLSPALIETLEGKLDKEKFAKDSTYRNDYIETVEKEFTKHLEKFQKQIPFETEIKTEKNNNFVSCYISYGEIRICSIDCKATFNDETQKYNISYTYEMSVNPTTFQNIGSRNATNNLEKIFGASDDWDEMQNVLRQCEYNEFDTVSYHTEDTNGFKTITWHQNEQTIQTYVTIEIEI